MIERLIAALDDPDGQLTAETIAEALWFAQFLPAPPRTEGSGGSPPPVERAGPPGPESGLGGREPPDERYPAGEPDDVAAEPPAVAAQMFATAVGRDTELRSPLVMASSPAVHALPQALEIERALAPLRRAVPNDRERDLDEQGTAELSADTRQLQLRFVPTKDQWLDLALVIDRSPSMDVWDHVVTEFLQLVGRHNAFGAVRSWYLDAGLDARRPVLRAAPDGPPHHPRELIDPARRRLVLVVSDCIAPVWEGDTLKQWLAVWGHAGPVAIAQPLPQRLWHRCRPVMHLVSLMPPYPGAPMSRMNPASRDNSVTIPRSAVAIPVVELTAPWLAAGANLVTGRVGGRVNAIALLTTDPPEMVEDGADDEGFDTAPFGELSPAERVRAFREGASTNARHLAEFLAAAPLTLPVMRLVQQLMLPSSMPHDLAEVFLSGLVYRISPEQQVIPSDRVVYDFTKGVRALLLSGLRAGEALMILDEVSQFVNRHMGTSFDFPAFLSGEDTPLPDHDFGQPFAAVARDVLTALGGRYATLADRLNRAPAADPETTHELGPHPVPDRHDGRDKGDAVTETVEEAEESGTGRPMIWGDVPPKNPDFTGREALLRNLRRQLTNRVTALLPHTLHGLGGVGKTQLAVEYAYRYQSSYELVWWVPAEQQALLRQSLTALASRLDLIRPGEVDVSHAVAAVYDALRTGQRYRRWLLVFDNANRPEDLVPFLSNPGGHVLVTSRNDNWDGVAQPLEVDVFDRPESVTLLKRRLPTIGDVDADRVAHLLGDLPLALEQAANWIAATAIPISEYIRLLEERTVDALREGTPSTYDAPVAVAFGLSLDRLANQNAPALQLLELCAFFGAEPISIRLLPSGRYARNLPPVLADTVRDDIELRRAVRDIVRFGLAKVDSTRNSIQVHRLVQAVLRDRLSEQQRDVCRISVQEILEAYNPGDPTDDPTTWPRHGEIGPHVEASGAIDSDRAEIRTVVLDQIRYLYVTGDYASSLAVAEKAFHLWRETLGEDHRLTIVTARFLANAMRSTGDAVGAAAVNRRILDVARRALGEDHEHTLAVANSVGGDMRLEGRWTASKDLDEDLLARHRRVFGDDDPNTLRVANNLGVDLRLLGDFRRAYELDTDTWARRRRLLGDNHPDTVFSAITGVSRDLYGLGRYNEAIEIQRQWLPVLRNQLGAEHANVLLASRIHAATLRKAGLTQEASELSRDVVRRRRERYGDNHLETVSAMLTLFTALARTERVAEAKALGDETLRAYRRSMGGDHVFTYVCMTDYAIVLWRAGDYAHARELNEQAYRGISSPRALGPSHPYTLCTAVNLSNDLAAARNHHAAFELLSDTLPQARLRLGEDHPEALACAANLALDMQEIGMVEQAAALRDDTLRRFRAALNDDNHPDIVDTLRGRRLYCVVDPPPT